MTNPLLRSAALLTLSLLLAGVADAQVHYHRDGRPWNQSAERGPDGAVPGWYYNLGITGLRVELLPDAPKHLAVRYVFADSPAHGKIQVGDVIVGAGGKRFTTPHRNGYGMDKFGAHGPILDFSNTLDTCLARNPATLEVTIERPSSKKEGDAKPAAEQRVTLTLPAAGSYSATYPSSCEKSERVLHELCDYLVKHQKKNGSWGNAPYNTFAPLALLATDPEKYRDAIERNVRMHAETTKAKDSSWLINWRYMAAAIVLSEYHLATGAKWVVPELEEIYTFLISSQFVNHSQIAEKTKKDRPEDLPRDKMDSHGGWGHNPGFEGYGPISMLTGQGALAFSLMQRCGVKIDRERHDFAYAFLDRGTGPNGYVWYEDQVAGPKAWADMGRTGAAGIANALAPYSGEIYRKRAANHAKIIGDHPESFPDTHGSPLMGMGYAALAAHTDPEALRKLMDANRFWFVLSRCTDGSFYYQPNRDNAGYGPDSRIGATAVTAFIFALPRRSLVMTGAKR
ncbi:MAG: DUF6288 domain-containing protein [Planctomycetota bacterium]